MTPAPATATLLLPPRGRFGGLRLSPVVAAALGRAERLPAGEAGERAQLLRHFELLPRGWPVAALTRSLDAGDAATAAWLRADPGYVRPDINGARLLAHGEALQLERADIDALLPALRPLFGDAGFPIDAPVPARWYLRLPRGARLPAFAEPADVLGADLFEHLPEGAEGRRWRALLSEAQVVLHNHPWNAQRAAAGKLPVNSLWFWGGGVLPDHVRTPHTRIRSNAVELAALAQAAGVGGDGDPGDALLDLRAATDFETAVADWIGATRRGELRRLTLDFGDGGGFMLERRQRWRLWRRPLATLA